MGVEVSYSRMGILLNADGCSSWRDSKRQLELGIMVQGVHHQHRYMLLSHSDTPTHFGDGFFTSCLALSKLSRWMQILVKSQELLAKKWEAKVLEILL